MIIILNDNDDDGDGDDYNALFNNNNLTSCILSSYDIDDKFYINSLVR